MKAIITAAGLGTRMLPSTKEQPKEMLPVYSDGYFKPVVQIIFEQLFDAGVREYCIVTGKGKQTIEKHFVQDYTFVSELLKQKKPTEMLSSFYRKLDVSDIYWRYQPEPRGFGDAVLQCKTFAGREPFLVHAGDTFLISTSHIRQLLDFYESEKADAMFLVFETDNPQMYGIVEGTERANGTIIDVNRVVEKPQTFLSNLAIFPAYIFKPEIFDAIGSIPSGKGEIQLTDAIQKLIDKEYSVKAINLRQPRIDVGTPELYCEAINLSYKYL